MKEEALENLKNWCFKLRSKKWWQPAVVEKIMICHYVDRYLEARENENDEKMKELIKKGIL